MITIDYDKNIVKLVETKNGNLDVILTKSLTLKKGQDTILDSSISITLGETFENVAFNGDVSDETDDYNNIFVSSELYNVYSPTLNNLEIYFFNCDSKDITLPKDSKIGELTKLIKYDDEYVDAIKSTQNVRYIYDNNGLKVISTNEETYNINETEFEVDTKGNKVLKIFYPKAN